MKRLPKHDPGSGTGRATPTVDRAGEERLQKLEMVSIRTLDEDICEQTRNYGKLGLF